MTDARSETLHDLAAFVARSWLAGLLAAVFVPVALAAAGADLLVGCGRRDGHLRRVLEASASLQRALYPREPAA